MAKRTAETDFKVVQSIVAIPRLLSQIEIDRQNVAELFRAVKHLGKDIIEESRQDGGPVIYRCILPLEEKKPEQKENKPQPPTVTPAITLEQSVSPASSSPPSSDNKHGEKKPTVFHRSPPVGGVTEGDPATQFRASTTSNPRFNKMRLINSSSTASLSTSSSTSSSSSSSTASLSSSSSTSSRSSRLGK